MRYAVALVIAFVLIVAMIAGSSAMARKMKAYEEQQKVLPLATVWMANAAMFVRAYWYLLFPAVIAASLGVAVLLGDGPKDDAQE